MLVSLSLSLSLQSHSFSVVSDNPCREYVREMSFSSSLEEETLRFTMHIDSRTSFKQAIDSLQPGDTISLFKIKGSFLLPPSTSTPIVFIAGGVGMTPFRSLILEANKKYNITLIQVQRGNDFLFQSELQSYLSPGSYYPTQPEDYLSMLDQIIAEKEKTNTLFYLCGSQRFLESALGRFQDLQVDQSKILIEKFYKQRR
jgi:ferredoxin-NADP reductase